MHSRWVLALLAVAAIALAGCGSVATPGLGTPTLPPISTSIAATTATQTAAPPATPTPTAVPTATRAQPRDEIVLTWQREGGIAGFCDSVIVYADGTVRVTRCRGELVEEKRLSDAQAGQVAAWVEALEPFEYKHSDNAVADRMTVQMTFSGRGEGGASEAQVQDMLDLAASLALVPASEMPIAAVETDVRYLLTNEDVPIRAGPGAEYLQIGPVFAGQVAWVTGASVDGAWWRVICPDDTVGDCWLPADRKLTQPTTPSGAWQVHVFSWGLSVDYPAGWSYDLGSFEETQRSVWFYPMAADTPHVSVEVYSRPARERDVANPSTWEPNEGGYRVHWSRPITTVQGLTGIEFVWGAFLEGQNTWDTPPTLMAVYYSDEHELDVRLTSMFDEKGLELLETAGFTDTVAARFGFFHRMAQSVRLYPTAGWETYHDIETGGRFDLQHPSGWTVRVDEIECGVVYTLDTLQLLAFEACWSDAADAAKLTFFETYQRFRESFTDERVVTTRDVSGLRVQVVGYGQTDDNGILALSDGPGTVALWQIGEHGFALIDQGNQHLQDGIYDGVLGSFLILGTMWDEPQPVEGRPLDDGRQAFELPGVGLSAIAPAGYGMVVNNEYLRRGSYISFDFMPYGGDTPRLYEIQFFSEASIRAFHERCTGAFCFEGDYPDVERYRAQKAAIAQCVDLPPYQAKRFGERCYLVSSHRCTGDACVIREYTAYMGDRKVDVWITMRTASQADASDALFATFDIVE